MIRLIDILWWLAATSCCHGYRFFQDRIPNGKFVPHPCMVGFNWEGVGHLEEQGGGPRNPFGLDFNRNGNKWDRTVCMMDSDGDGRTNGEELGDPGCVWDIGQQPSQTKDLSHPGVCDPWNSPQCKERTTFVTCSGNQLDCPAINEPGIKNITISLPKSPVPDRETTYACAVFEYPTDGDYHMVANEPALDNRDVMHHILLFGCENEDTEHAPGEVYDCQMEVDKNCKSVLAVWSFGMAGECAHSDMGFRIGQRGFKRGVIQLHWTNPEKRTDYTDGSGLMVYMTTKLRPYNAGVLMVGQDYIVIPPGEKEVNVDGVCSSECTQSLLNGDVKISVAYNHMHGLGVSMKVEHFRDGIKLRDVGDDPIYDYDSPVLHVHKKPFTVKQGDEIRTRCVYKSTSRTRTTFYGDGTHDEMCFSFITYYPKENIPMPSCVAFQEVTKCAFNISEVIEGCRFEDLHNLDYPQTKATYDLVMDNCSPTMGCLRECLPVVKRLKKTSCYTEGVVDDWARLRVKELSSDVLKMMTFYAALDSCDVEIAKEKYQGTEAKCSDVIIQMTAGAGRTTVSLLIGTLWLLVGMIL